MNYRSAISYLDSLESTNIELGLERTYRACELLGSPERKFKSIIVAGTNGKGSTCAFLESILRTRGLKVGFFISPHLIDVRERIQINREMIPEGEFARIATAVIASEAKQSPVIPPSPPLGKGGDQFFFPPLEKGGQGGFEDRLTYFEFLTAMAFQYFAEEKVDIAILEVGLGGRFDSTNVVLPEVSVITRIGLDHQKYLGDTIEKIAFEKCGIIKKGVPVVTVDQAEPAMQVIRDTAEKNGSMLYVVKPWDIKYKLGLLGEHQFENAACAMRAAELVSTCCSHNSLSSVCHPREETVSRCRGGALSPPNNAIECILWPAQRPATTLRHSLEGGDDKASVGIATALANTNWPGRLEIVSKEPLVILDGAHNPNGAETLARFLRMLKPNPPQPPFRKGGSLLSSPPLKKGGQGGFRKIIVLFGVMADKDVEGIIKPLLDVADEWVLSKPNTPRAMPTSQLKEVVCQLKDPKTPRPQDIKTIEPLSEAIKQTMNTMPKDAALIITGSLYTVGEAKNYLFSSNYLAL